jgi:hypothetical protein
MTRLLANPLFWLLAFVLTWLVVITLLIAVGPNIAPDSAGPANP